MATKKSTAMTKKSSSKRSRSAKKTTTPAQRFLRYELVNSATPGVETSHYIDLMRDLSRVNRRLMRQGRVVHIKRVTVLSTNTMGGIGGGFNPNILQGSVDLAQQNAGGITISTVPDTWVSREAWKRGFRVWNEMNKTATENLSGNIAGTWADFKVYMSNEMRSGTVLSPLDNGGNSYNAGAWDYSELVSPDGTTSADPFQVHMLGNHNGNPGAWNSVSLIKSYGESRATVQLTDPSVPSDASDDPLVNVFDYGTTVDEVVNNLEAFNDSPPYGLVNYPGDDGNGPKPAVVAQTSIANGSAVLSGFHSLCGLLEIETRSPIANDEFGILVELAVGSYRGIKADVI
ncbi:MAG: hypothetical protein [Circular genetic element sp.]|nr:MAG: hypothetical protein [Circular genetic element sp.]